MDVNKRHSIFGGAVYLPLTMALPGKKIAFRSLHFSQFRNAIPRHSHSFFETVYFIEGRGVYVRIDLETGEEHAVEYGPGTLIDVAPGTVHRFTPAETNRFAYWTWEAAGGAGFKEIRPLKHAPDAAVSIGPLIELIRYEYLRSPVKSPPAVRFYIRQLIRNMFDVLYPSNPSESAGQGRPVRAHRLADQILTFVRDNFYLDIKLDDVARQFNVTPRHLIRLLKAADPPVRFRRELARTRVRAARQLMVRRPQTPLAVIAGDVGFKDEYYFAKVFKKETGEPPGRFRRRLQGETRKEKYP